MKVVPHPDPNQLAAYVLGKLPWSDLEKVEMHVETCAACRSQVTNLEENADSFISCLRETRVMGGGEATNSNELDHLLAAVHSLAQPTVSDASKAASPPKMVAGHEVLRELARGGLGVVYLARHQLLNDCRAIKRPQTRDGLDRAILLARFRREVEAVGALRHDHIVRAHDAGADEDGPYLVMEYLDGTPLSQLLASRQLTPAAACELVRQAALGLQAAHERGLVHRDVKPSNLMLARVGAGARVVVIDWGLVKQADEAGQSKPVPEGTRTDTAIGTPDYIAPEQARDARSVDIRADVYSLGVTLYALLARRPPFRGRPELEKLLAHQKEAFPPLDRVRSDVPAALLSVIKKMVAKDPARRYATPAQVVVALESFCSAAPGLVDLLDGAKTPAPPPVKRRRIGWRLAAAACLLLAAIPLGLLVRGMTLPGPKKGDDPPADHGAGVLGAGPALPVSMSDRHRGLCTSLVFMPDGLHAVSEDGGGEIVIWDLQKQRRKKGIPHQSAKPLPELSGVVAVSADGRYIAAAGINVGVEYMDSLSLLDQKTYTLTGDNYRFDPSRLGPAMAFSPDGAQLAVTEQPGVLNRIIQPFFGKGKMTLSLLDIKAGRWKKLPVESPINSLAFSPDGHWLVTSSDEKNLRLWNLKENRQEREIAGHERGADQVAFSADGTKIYSASSADDTLRVCNSGQDGKEVKRISLGKTAAKMVVCAFWPGGRALTGHADGNVISWDVATGAELKRFPHKDARITAVAISPDGHHALAAHSDGSVYLYRLPSSRNTP